MSGQVGKRKPIRRVFDGEPGAAIELQNSGTYIQWRYAGDVSWTNLIAVADITGDDGQEVELQNTGTYIQWRYVGGSWTNLISVAAITGPGYADGDYGDIAISGSVTLLTIKPNTVTYAKFQQVAALSIVGNSTNATADAAAITAGSDHQIMRRSGTAIAFGSIDLSQSAAVGTSRLAYANLTQLAGLSVLGVTGTSTADVAALTGIANQVLRVNGAGTSLAFGSIDLSQSAAVGTSRLAYANIAQLAGLSVLGVTGTSTADVAALTGTANQVLVVNGAGTALAFGQVNLSSPSAVSGTLAEGKGGTGNNTYAIGDLLYASGTTTLSKLADVSAGSYLRSGGVTTAPLWSTLKLPNTSTQYYVPYPATSNNYNESSNFQFDGTNLSVGGASSGHRLNIISGTLADQKNALKLSATLPSVPTTHNNFGVDLQITSAGSASFNQYAANIALAAGYTGSLSTYGLRVTNSALGTGAFEPFVANTGQAYNAGLSTVTIGSTSGSNYGYWNLSRSGAINCAMFGLVDLSRSNGKNYGVFGNVNAATSGTSINVGTVGVAINGSVMVGGFFGLLSSVPTLTSAALMCDNGSQTSDIFVARDNGTAKWSIVDGGHTTWGDAVNMVFNTSTGTKIGTATSQKIGVWNATPIVQPTTAVAAATFVANTSAIANDTATFDGYTIGQVVKALRNIGLLA